MENITTETKPLWLEILNQELAEKKSRNPRYSVRAFSRDLGISQSHLTRILNGQRKLSSEQACRIALTLGMAPNLMIELITSTVRD